MLGDTLPAKSTLMYSLPGDSTLVPPGASFRKSKAPLGASCLERSLVAESTLLPGCWQELVPAASTLRKSQPADSRLSASPGPASTATRNLSLSLSRTSAEAFQLLEAAVDLSVASPERDAVASTLRLDGSGRLQLGSAKLRAAEPAMTQDVPPTLRATVPDADRTRASHSASFADRTRPPRHLRQLVGISAGPAAAAAEAFYDGGSDDDGGGSDCGGRAADEKEGVGDTSTTCSVGEHAAESESCSLDAADMEVTFSITRASQAARASCGASSDSLCVSQSSLADTAASLWGKAAVPAAATLRSDVGAACAQPGAAKEAPPTPAVGAVLAAPEGAHAGGHQAQFVVDKQKLEAFSSAVKVSRGLPADLQGELLGLLQGMGTAGKGASRPP